MKSLSSKTYQCGVTIQGLTTLSGTVYLTGITNTASWDHVIVGTTAQGQIYTRTYAQFMGDVATGISLSSYVPTSRTLTINGTGYDLSADRTWTITTPYVSKLQHQVKAGVAINKGQAVYVTGADGTNMIVGLASNASEATSSKTMGLLDATVSTNGFANVVTEGLLAGLDTTGATAAGDPVWLGTGGNLIYGLASKPYAPAHLVFIGIVTRRNVSNGEIFVKVQNGFELKEIHDVDLFTTAPINGHLLGFDGILWVNKTIAGWLGYTPANASGTTNYISKFTGSTTLGNSQIFDNGTNVGIGTATPTGKLEVFTSSDNQLRLDASGTYSAMYLTQNQAVKGAVWMNHGSLGMFVGTTVSNGYLAFGSDGSYERMRITSPGNVVINSTSTPYIDDKLYIASGNIILDNNRGYLQYTTGGARATLLALNSSNNLSVGQSNTNNASLLLYGGTGNVTVNAGAIEVARFTTAGNVGIGTVTPSGKFDIAHDMYTGAGAGVLQAGAYGNINFKGASSQGTITTQQGITWQVDSYAGSTNYGVQAQIAVGNNGNVGTFMGLFTSDNYSIPPVERIRIQYNGNVGIGTTAPTSKLHVWNGGIKTTGFPSMGNPFTFLESNYSDAAVTVRFQNINPTNNLEADLGIQLMNTGGSMADVLRIKGANGNVGIGTTSPTEKLHVNGDTRIVGNTYVGGIINAYQGDASIWVPNLGQAFTIKQTTGNVGIGTNSPKAKLQVNNGHIAVYHNVSTDGAQIYLGDTNFDNSGYWNSAPGIGSVFSPGTTVAGDLAFYVYTGVSNSRTERMRIIDSGNVGIGTTTPSTKLDVSGVITATGGNSTNWNTAYGWGNHASAGYVPQARTLTINGTSYDLSANRTWTIATTTAAGSDTQVQYNSSGSLAGASALIYNSTTNRVGINQASPGYDLDVNGQVRVQDKLRVGTVNSGNGVVHMSSTATINPSATTIVWAQNVSVGMCAFIEYYILNSNTATDQRAGTIIVTWNQSGTPTITHTETTTPDIGSTVTVNFTSSLVGSDARINAVNSSANPYTMVMSYKYF
jgi:hypothetical protein